MRQLKKQSGITLITLIVIVIVVSITTGTVITTSSDSLKVKNLNNLYADIKSLNDSVFAYYNKYGTLPVSEEYTVDDEFYTIKNVYDNETYQVIDENKLNRLILTKKLTWENDDVYIINTKTHTIYYPKGVTFENEKYYSLPLERGIPISNEEELSKIGTGQKATIYGKEYTLLPSEKYILTNDIVYTGDYSEIISRIEENNIEIVGNEHEIEVTTNGVTDYYVEEYNYCKTKRMKELIFANQSINKIYSTELQTANIKAASDGTGIYTYTEVSEQNSVGTETSYISISGTIINIAANTPAGVYTYLIRATDSNSGAIKDATYTITVGKQALNPVTNLEIGTNGKVTWNQSSNSTGYEISIDNNNWTRASSGIDYLETITAESGSRTVYVRAINNDNENYITPSANATKTVRVVTLTISSANISYGTVDNESYNVISGATYEVNNNTILIKSGETLLKTITATKQDAIGYTTEFSNWSSTSGTISEETTVIANFERNADAYSIGYTLNGGTIATANPTSYTVETDNITLNNPTKTGYTFTGWSGTGLTGDTNTAVTIPKGSTGNRTYTANWTINTYTVSYNLNSDDMNTWEKAYGERFGITYNSSTKLSTINITGSGGWEMLYIPITTVSGHTYNFKCDYQNITGFASSYDGIGIQALTKVENTNNSANSLNTIYASKTQNTTTTYTLTFTATGTTTYLAFNFGMCTDGAALSVALGNFVVTDTVTYNNAIGNTMFTPSKQGYTFNGWFTAASGGTQVTSTTTMPAANTTYYAHWTANTYTIGYTLNGGTVATANPTSYTVETNNITLNNPTKTGYTFTGWTGSNGTTAQTTVTIAKGSTGNKTYTANWTDNIQPSVTFSQNGNSTASKTVNTVVTVTDSGSGVKASTLKYLWTTRSSGITASDFTGINSGTFTTGSTLTLPSKNGGEYYLYVYAEDNAGNNKLVNTNKFVVSNINPEADITLSATTWPGSNVTITIKPYAPTVLWDTGYLATKTRDAYGPILPTKTYAGQSFRMSGSVKTITAPDPDTYSTGVGFRYTNTSDSANNWPRPYGITLRNAMTETSFSQVYTIPDTYKSDLRPFIQINVPGGTTGYQVDYKNLKYEYFDYTKISSVKVNGTAVTITNGVGTYTATAAGTYTIVITDIYGNTATYTKTIAKAANPIAVTASQSWSPTFGTSNQDHAFTAATSGQGAVTYAIQSQKNTSGTAVSYFSIPTAGTASLRMAANTPASGSKYTVVIRATAAGNANYNSAYKDITYTITVNKATPTVTLSATSGSVNVGAEATFTATPNLAGKWNVTTGNARYVTISSPAANAPATANTATTIKYKGVAVTTSAVAITVKFTPTNTNYSEVSKTFNVTVNESNGIPTAYQKVEYIQANGTQWIDTGVPLNGKYAFYMDGCMLESKSGVLLNGYANGTNRMGMTFFATSNKVGYYWFSTGYKENTNLSITLTQRFQVDQNCSSAHIYQGSKRVDITYSGATTAYSNMNIYIFNTAANANYKNGTIYEAIIYDPTDGPGWSDEAGWIRHFIPCKRKSDGVIGLYDTVGNKFYTNSGTGTFVAGPNV
ncbi:MAG: InlB B-repeat-containing protein [Clostridia bacterium]|nr:InlB B-repeat-containing protein [Clostridia bacterium]